MEVKWGSYVLRSEFLGERGSPAYPATPKVSSKQVTRRPPGPSSYWDRQPTALPGSTVPPPCQACSGQLNVLITSVNVLETQKCSMDQLNHFIILAKGQKRKKYAKIQTFSNAKMQKCEIANIQTFSNAKIQKGKNASTQKCKYAKMQNAPPVSNCLHGSLSLSSLQSRRVQL